MTAIPDHLVLVDTARSVRLCDVGMPGYTLAACVAADGSDQFWLVAATANASNPRRNAGYQRHELVGRLPGYMRDRIWGSQLRCGRETSTGSPCRHRVKNPGDTCSLHARPARR